MSEKLLTFLSKNKNLFFLLMCLLVHIFNSVCFFALGIFPLSILNIFSSLFYTFVVLFFKKKENLYIIFTYFEIVTFSFISELFTGCSFFYMSYVIGMISVIFYLLPPKQHLKHIFQGIGILYAFAIYYVYVKSICLFPEYLDVISIYKYKIGFLNLCITLFCLAYISNLYFFEMNAASDKLTYCSNHDLMTGLFNRRFFEHIMRRNKNENENEYTIAIFDIDDFKKVNDTYGHETGDNVLKIVSSIISDCTSNEYVPVRWGGEEFILYMPQTDETKAYEYLETICNKIRKTVVNSGEYKISVSVTIGMSTGRDLTEYESVIREADNRLYYGKRHGKNCVVKTL